MKVTVETLAGETMSPAAATTRLTPSLCIAPAFVASTTDATENIRRSVEAHYSENLGRYAIRGVTATATEDVADEDLLRYTPTQALIQAAVPHCVLVRMHDEFEERWISVSDLTTQGDGRIIPAWLAEAVVSRGVRDERWDVVEILYGTATLAELPPVKLIASELSVPERTAGDWIQKARAAGRLVGLYSGVGRPAKSS